MAGSTAIGDLSAEELEQQGTYAHATRNWVFLHGTAEQFRNHTDRMLALEQEYLRRFPKRTWQGTSDEPVAVDEATQLRVALRGLSVQIDALLGVESRVPMPGPGSAGSERAQLLLMRVAAAGGRMHKLELHQVAREVGVEPAALAALYRGAAPLLLADRDERILTTAGAAAVG